MKKQLVLFLVMLISTALIYSACKKEKAQAVQTTVTTVDTCASITYSKTISVIVTNYCSTGSGCHGTGSSNGVFTSYAAINSEISNGKLTYSTNPNAVIGKSLDMSGSSYANLTASQINEFICWLKNGALNN